MPRIPVDPFKFNIGDQVHDVVTGSVGIITGRHQWITGCNTYSINLPAEEGKESVRTVSDENVLEIVKRDAIELPSMKEAAKAADKPKPKPRTGGPRSHPSAPGR